VRRVGTSGRSTTERMRRTKIIATVGPASSDPDTLQRMLRAGVNVFRLNFSHGTHESHTATFGAIRDAAAAVGRHVAVLQDLSGPKIRTGRLEADAPITLVPDRPLRIAVGDGMGSGDRIFTPYAPLIASARPGDRLLLDDGRIELRVTATGDGEIVTTVVNGGPLGEHKGINAPGVALPASAITEKDEQDLRLGLDLGVDLVALSFVQTADDLHQARRLMREAGREVPLIAKIERPAAVDNLESILEVASGLMVARGDLGLEMPLEQVPRMQKHIIRRSRASGIPVILATQVLESMRHEPRPTRAEVSDAANAVDDGADAIMLAGETAAGLYPVQSVETLDAVIRDAELMPPSERVVPLNDQGGSRHARALCEAAVTLATTARADAIVAVTRRGRTARMLASLRPPIQVFAATPDVGVIGATSLLWGIEPVLAAMPGPDERITSETKIDQLEQMLLHNALVQAGAVLVFVNVSADLGRTDANFVIVRRVD
jgi:pyruvate kinase